jgi:hypothetical protein
MCIRDTLESTDIGKNFLTKFPQMMVLEKVEGHARHTGKHAAGIFLSNTPIKNFCAVDRDGVVMMDKHDVEGIGGLKIDCLGLRMLSVIGDCLEMIGMSREELLQIDLEDEKAFDVLNRHHFAGIFQFEGYALQSLTKQMKVEEFNDVVAITSLARPGPLHCGGATAFIARRVGDEPVTHMHPMVAPFTQDTLGTIVYQEQVMEIGRAVGKLSWEDVSKLRKAMSKSLGEEFFNQYWLKFEKGASENGIESKDAKLIWDSMCTFGSWAFNKSHAVSYGMISYYCCWLKAYHPLEYAASNLMHSKDDASAVKMLRELVKSGYEYAEFDKDLSEENWSIKDGKLVGGFLNIKGVGAVTAGKMVKAREGGKALTAGEIKKLATATTPYGDIFETERRFGDYYVNPERYKINSQHPDHISSIQDEGEYIFIGKLVAKNLRDLNEYKSVVERGGKLVKNNPLLLNFTVEDDTDSIICTINRWDYPKVGKKIAEEAQLGQYFLIKGSISGGWRKVNVDKIRWLNMEDK